MPQRSIAAVQNGPRILAVINSDSSRQKDLSAELERCGSSLQIAVSVSQASQICLANAFDVIFVESRPDPSATQLLLGLLRAQAKGAPIFYLPGGAEQGNEISALVDVQLDANISVGAIATRLIEVGFGAVSGSATLSHQVPESDAIAVLFLPDRPAFLELPSSITEMRQIGAVPDCVVMTSERGLVFLPDYLPPAAAAVVPLIDACGLFSDRADVCVPQSDRAAILCAIEQLAPISKNMRALPASYFADPNPLAHLLTRLALRGRGAVPFNKPNHPATLFWRDGFLAHDIERLFDRLTDAGALRRTFHDRFHCCPACSSARVLVREECAKCRSGELTEEPILHHLRCGFQGPERDYRRDDRLICPKCRQYLEYFSVDYDRPGLLSICGACSHMTGEAAIGFRCLDCESRNDSSQMVIKTVHAYHLTEYGQKAGLEGRCDFESNVDEIARIMKTIVNFTIEQRRKGDQYCVLRIYADPKDEILRKHGERQRQETIQLASRILREMFTDETDMIASGRNFLILIGNDNETAVNQSMEMIKTELEKNLSLDLQFTYEAIGADRLQRIIDLIGF